jgi:hypothetical protein
VPWLRTRSIPRVLHTRVYPSSLAAAGWALGVAVTDRLLPASRWIGASRLHTLTPRGTAHWKKLYRLRGAVGRENGRLKNEWGLATAAGSPP